MDWIKVSEKLPVIGIDVLIWDGEARSVGYLTTYEGMQFHDFTIGGLNHSVTHWMPLPSPPERE